MTMKNPQYKLPYNEVHLYILDIQEYINPAIKNMSYAA